LPQLARLPDDRDSLTYLRLTGSEPVRELVVIRHLQRYQSRGAEQFLALLREHVGRRQRNGGGG
jgi:LysR family hydrogen peroxide-inducible transcriptional activator